MNFRKSAALILSSAILVACSGSDDNKSELIQDAQFEAYLKLKRIPVDDEKRIASALIVYNEREKIAEAIEDTELLDSAMVDVEVEEFRKQMLISRYFDEYIKKNVTKESIQNYYNNNMQEFERRKIHVAHILFRTNTKMSDAEKNARLLIAKEAYFRVQKNEDFSALVKEYSDDKLSVQKAGDLGWLEEGAIDPIFSRTVFEMETDQISEPFVTAYGYHIVKVIEGPKVMKKPFESVKGDISYRLKQQAKTAEMNRLKDEIKS